MEVVNTDSDQSTSRGLLFFFFSSRRRHTRFDCDWSSDVCSSDLDDALGIHRALRELLGPGRGTCLEIGCGTGQHAAGMRRLGWTPVGVDISAGKIGRAHVWTPGTVKTRMPSSA